MDNSNICLHTETATTWLGWSSSEHTYKDVKYRYIGCLILHNPMFTMYASLDRMSIFSIFRIQHCSTGKGFDTDYFGTNQRIPQMKGQPFCNAVTKYILQITDRHKHYIVYTVPAASSRTSPNYNPGILWTSSLVYSCNHTTVVICCHCMTGSTLVHAFVFFVSISIMTVERSVVLG